MLYTMRILLMLVVVVLAACSSGGKRTNNIAAAFRPEVYTPPVRHIDTAASVLLDASRQNQCASLDNWLVDLITLYGSDFTYQGQARTGLAKKVAPGFRDDMFVARIGKPYTQLDRGDRRQIAKILDECHKGPRWGMHFLREPFTGKQGEAGYDEWQAAIRQASSGLPTLAWKQAAAETLQKKQRQEAFNKKFPLQVLPHQAGTLIYSNGQQEVHRFRSSNHAYSDPALDESKCGSQFPGIAYLSLVVRHPGATAFRMTRQSVSQILTPELIRAIQVECPRATSAIVKLYLDGIHFSDTGVAYAWADVPKDTFRELPFGYANIDIRAPAQATITDLSGFNGSDPDRVPDYQTLAGLKLLRENNWSPQEAVRKRQQQEVDDRHFVQNSPFQHLKAALYIQSVYAGDFSRAKRVDAEFVAPYRSMPMASLFQEAIRTSRLVRAMLAVYLLGYEDMYGKCLRPDAVSFKKTVTSETVYKDGWGNEKYRVRHPEQITHFRVNREFAGVFESIGLANPDSPIAPMFDQWLREDGTLTLRDVMDGTRQIMQENSCDSPLIRRLERQMLAYYQQPFD